MCVFQGHRSTDDEELVEAIRTSFSSTDTIMIFDARPKVNAVANQAMGKGFESEKLYKQSRVKFLNIANIHVMRESIHKMTDAIALSQTSALSSDWIEHVKRILVSAVTVAAGKVKICLPPFSKVLLSKLFISMECLVWKKEAKPFFVSIFFSRFGSLQRWLGSHRSNNVLGDDHA